MDNKEPLLKIRFDGEAVGPGRIPVAHLLRFLANLNKVFQRTGRVLMGEAQSVRRRPESRSIKDEVALDLVLLTHGSPAAVLGFERKQTQMVLSELDQGMVIFEKAIAGLSSAQNADDAMPTGYDSGVLMAWRDAGLLFSQGIKKIEIALNHREKPLSATFFPEGLARIQERIKGPQTNIRTIEGRLLMADFKEHGTRCRVHPSAGEPVLCLFEEGQKEEVLEDILHFVRIVGEAREDPITGRIASIRIHDIERLEDRENEDADLLPQGTPISRSFWETPTLEELAESQGVKPISDIEALLGGWPGDPNDGFEEEVLKMRQFGVVGA